MTKITKKTFTNAVEHSNGTRVDISRRLQVTKGAITIYLSKNPEMAKLLDDKRLSNIDRAENEIFTQLDYDDEDSSPAAARIRQSASTLIVKTLGKDKGWVEKQEVEYSGISEIKINIPKEVKDLL